MKTFKTVMLVLAVELVLAGSAAFWVLRTPDDATATVAVSREWVGRLQLEEMKRSARIQELEDALQAMANTCGILDQYGRKVM